MPTDLSHMVKVLVFFIFAICALNHCGTSIQALINVNKKTLRFFPSLFLSSPMTVFFKRMKKIAVSKIILIVTAPCLMFNTNVLTISFYTVWRSKCKSLYKNNNIKKLDSIHCLFFCITRSSFQMVCVFSFLSYFFRFIFYLALFLFLTTRYFVSF